MLPNPPPDFSSLILASLTLPFLQSRGRLSHFQQQDHSEP